jgi:hypothetical protein
MPVPVEGARQICRPRIPGIPSWGGGNENVQNSEECLAFRRPIHTLLRSATSNNVNWVVRRRIFFLSFLQEGHQASGGFVVGLARDADVVERRTGVAHTQPVQGRIGRHHARQEDIGPRVRKGRPPQADDKHDRRTADVSDRLGGESGQRGTQQSHTREEAEEVQARAEAFRREGADFRTGEYGVNRSANSERVVIFLICKL